MRWRLIQDPPADGAANMALDEAILERAVAAPVDPTLRLYGWDPATLSLGSKQPAASSHDLGWLLDVMAVLLGQHVLPPCAGLGRDVLEGLHLLGQEATAFLEDPHAGHGCLDGQRAQDPGEERNDQRGAETEQQGR